MLCTNCFEHEYRTSLVSKKAMINGTLQILQDLDWWEGDIGIRKAVTFHSGEHHGATHRGAAWINSIFESTALWLAGEAIHYRLHGICLVALLLKFQLHS